MKPVPPSVDSILGTLGNTPLVRLRALEERGGPRLYAKCEFLGPGNSIFDRAAIQLLQKARKQGELQEGDVVATWGGSDAVISLALAATGSGHPILVAVPANLHPERRQALSDYGARLVMVEPSLGAEGARTMLVAELPAFVASKGRSRAKIFDLFGDPEATEAFAPIGAEVVQALEGNPDLLVCGLDLGAIPTGIAQGLEAASGKRASVVAVEPENARIASEKTFAPHLLGGLAPSSEPVRLDFDAVAGFEAVSDEEAWRQSELLSRKTGILAGIASGAVLAASLRRARDMRSEQSIVAVLPDSGERRFMLADLFD